VTPSARAKLEAHYENFPVHSAWVPTRIRPLLGLIYRFVRNADTLADEGNTPAHTRIEALDALYAMLHQAQPPEWIQALRQGFTTHNLSLQPLWDMKKAFISDSLRRPFLDYADLCAYCASSAQPIGRLMLTLFGVHHPCARTASDALCTALQLLNFLQDLSADTSLRGYHSVVLTETALFQEHPAAWQERQCLRIHEWLDAARPLLRIGPPSLRLYTLWIHHSARRLTHALRRRRDFTHACRLNIVDIGCISVKTLLCFPFYLFSFNTL
jgi:phytoene/squalene synthetase